MSKVVKIYAGYGRFDPCAFEKERIELLEEALYDCERSINGVLNVWSDAERLLKVIRLALEGNNGETQKEQG